MNSFITRLLLAALFIVAATNLSVSAEVNSTPVQVLLPNEPTLWYYDGDKDGYGNPSISVLDSIAPSNYVSDNTDCNDANATIHPNEADLCNSVDDDCDGSIDEDATFVLYYTDADHDGYGSSISTPVSLCSNPGGGLSTNNLDCNDMNSAIHPWFPEACNNVDDDCNGLIDDGAQSIFYADADGDGYGSASNSISTCAAPFGYVTNSQDCNDANADIHPGAVEVCNGVDDDCDNLIDEGFITAFISPSDTFTICNTSSLELKANSGSNLAYQWMKNGTKIPGAIKATYIANSTGAYSVKVKHGGCFSISKETVIKTINKTINVSPAGITKVCPGTSVVFSITDKPGLTFQWHNSKSNISGATNKFYSASDQDSYYAAITDVAGCIINSSKSTLLNYDVEGCEIRKQNINTVASCDLKVYPNPSGGNFIFQFHQSEDENAKGLIQVLNNFGQIILSQQAQLIDGYFRENVLLPDNLASGFYYFKFSISGRDYTGPLSLQK